MAFLEDPRLRQRWNQITQDAEAVTETAAAGIWSFQHHYINPCFGSITDSIEQCTTVCLGDPEERLRRRRERDRTRGRAEHSFDFYDDWDEEQQESGGLLGNWAGDDWDRLLAGTGSQRRRGGGDTTEQPRRKRGMSYGTRGNWRKTNELDPNVIPASTPIGFLSKLPWKVGGTLRYKPSAADLQEHPRRHAMGETEPLLDSDEGMDLGRTASTRKRSGTTGSGDTSDSYRSRGDLFPSDGEGEEDAIPLADDVTYDMVRRDDKSSGKTRRSSKGKRPLARSRTVSRTTIGSNGSKDSPRLGYSSGSLQEASSVENVPSLEALQMEEARLGQEEDEEVARKKQAAAHLAQDRGLKQHSPELPTEPEPKPDLAEDDARPESPEDIHVDSDDGSDDGHDQEIHSSLLRDEGGSDERPADEAAFVPARLPNFG